MAGGRSDADVEDARSGTAGQQTLCGPSGGYVKGEGAVGSDLVRFHVPPIASYAARRMASTILSLFPTPERFSLAEDPPGWLKQPGERVASAARSP